MISSTDMIIYEKIKSKIAQNYECKMRNERNKTLIQIITESIDRHRSRITFLQKSLSKLEETYTNLKSIYKENTEQFEKFDDDLTEDVEEYYDELNSSYEIIATNLVTRKKYIRNEINISKEKLNKEVDDKDIIEFINKITKLDTN